MRGAPCGATWKAAERVAGLKPDEAVVRMGLETQFFCSADPSGWDPIYGRSPVHLAGRLHSAALGNALRPGREQNEHKQTAGKVQGVEYGTSD